MADLQLCFVCSGNICRSPMAALVFGEHLRRAGLADRVRVTSAGIGSWHAGDPADSRAAQTLSRGGYPTTHVAAQVDEGHLAADLLLAMDSSHLEDLRALLARTGGDVDRVRMFRSFDPEANGDLDVPDPYYGRRQGFTEVLSMIESAVPGLLDWVRRHLDP
jgi:low molecular weight protein-tyrosine phosphatase